MRTPISSHTSRQDPDLTEELANGLAELLVQEYRRRHPQHNQQDLAATVGAPSGPNHDGINGGEKR